MVRDTCDAGSLAVFDKGNESTVYRPAREQHHADDDNNRCQQDSEKQFAVDAQFHALDYASQKWKKYGR